MCKKLWEITCYTIARGNEQALIIARVRTPFYSIRTEASFTVNIDVARAWYTIHFWAPTTKGDIISEWVAANYFTSISRDHTGMVLSITLLEPMWVSWPCWASGPVFDYSIICCRRTFCVLILVVAAPSLAWVPPINWISTSYVGNSGIDIAVPTYISKWLHIVYTLFFQAGNSGILFVFRLLFSFHLCNRLCMLFILKILCIFQPVDLGRGVI